MKRIFSRLLENRIMRTREGHFGSRQIVGSGLTFASTETSAENHAKELHLPEICRLPTSVSAVGVERRFLTFCQAIGALCFSDYLTRKYKKTTVLPTFEVGSRPIFGRSGEFASAEITADR